MKRKDFIISDNTLKHNKVHIEELNNKISSGEIEALVEGCEKFFYDQMDELLADMLSQPNKNLLFICGPSSSGKTTCSKLIRKELLERGHNSVVVSLDDFLLPHDRRARLSDGSVDYESVFTLDLTLFNNFIDDMLTSGKAEMPIFDFETNSRKAETNKATWKEGDIIIVEGIHAINPLIISRHVENAYKLYICPYDDLLFRDKTVLWAQELRMLRRCVRDCQTRGYSVEESLQSWKNVRRGEEENIKPFKLNCDYFLNTSLCYEILIYNNYFKDLFLDASQSAEVLKIVSCLDKCEKIDKSFVPSDSELWEFLIK